MARALLCKAFGPPDALVFEDVEPRRAAAGQVVVAVKAAAVNFPDTLIIQGKYQFRPEPPFSPGAEIAGLVQSVGEGVAGTKVGDPVLAQMPLPYGGFAEEVVLDEDALIPLPLGMDFTLAAAFGATYGTAYHALRDRGQVRPGESVLILGAAGGVGLAAVELARRMGAHVIAAASSDAKLATCRDYGAAETINYETQDLRAELRRLTNNKGVDVVVDPVGGRFAEPALRAMAWGGRYLVLGFASGEIPKLPANLTLLKGCAIVGVFWSGFIKHYPAESRDEMAELAKWVATGELKPLVSATYPMAQGGTALSDMLARKVQGKVVLLT